MVSLKKLILLAAIFIPFIYTYNSLSKFNFGEYKPIYLDSKEDLVKAREFLKVKGFKSIDEYTSEVEILDFPKSRKIKISDAKELNKNDLRKDNFLNKIENLFNVNSKKVLYVEKSFSKNALNKMNKTIGINAKYTLIDENLEINIIYFLSLFLIYSLLVFLNKNYSLFMSIFLLIALTVLALSKNIQQFYPIVIFFYLLFSLIDIWNKKHNEISTQTIKFSKLLQVVKIPLIIFSFASVYFTLFEFFLISSLEALFILTLALSIICIFLIVIWIKIDIDFTEKFIFPILLLNNKKKQTKIYKKYALLYYMLFIASIMPFGISSCSLKKHERDFEPLYAKKIRSKKLLESVDIYLKENDKYFPNISDYLYHKIYQSNLRYNIKENINPQRQIVEKRYIIKDNKIKEEKKIIYKVDKEWILNAIENDELAFLFLDKNKNPIIFYSNPFNEIETFKRQNLYTFLFTLPFLILIFLLKAIKYTLMAKLK